MPTDRISPSSSLLETLRAMARDRARGVSTPRATTGGAAEGATPRPARSIGELRQRIRELTSAVNVDDAQAVHQVRAPALREILLWEFGSDFRRDPQFLPMVDAIGNALDVDPGFQQRFVDLIVGLQKG